MEVSKSFLKNSKKDCGPRQKDKWVHMNISMIRLKDASEWEAKKCIEDAGYFLFWSSQSSRRHFKASKQFPTFHAENLVVFEQKGNAWSQSTHLFPSWYGIY